MSDPELPPVLAIGWGLTAPASRGPRPTMTAAGIVDAAIALADADGIAAVAMARVAERLGVTTMALYRYVSSKDDLLVLMVDAAMGPPPPRRRTRGWRPGLRHWVHDLFDRYQAHPWALDVPITGPPALPNQLAWLDRGLAELARTDLELAEQLSVMLLLAGFVRNAATLARDIAGGHEQAGSTPAEAEAQYQSLLEALVTAERFPALHAAVRGGLLSDSDPDDLGLEFGLATILDGVAARVGDDRP
jgi:AcrR family transcriptional regulator